MIFKILKEDDWLPVLITVCDRRPGKIWPQICGRGLCTSHFLYQQANPTYSRVIDEIKEKGRHQAHWPSFVIIFCQLLHVYVRWSFGDGRRQLGLEAIEQGQCLQGKNNRHGSNSQCKINYSRIPDRSVEMTLSSVILPLPLCLSSSSVFVSWDHRTSFFPPGTQPPPHCSALCPLERLGRHRDWLWSTHLNS